MNIVVNKQSCISEFILHQRDGIIKFEKRLTCGKNTEAVD